MEGLVNCGPGGRPHSVVAAASRPVQEAGLGRWQYTQYLEGTGAGRAVREAQHVPGPLGRLG